VHEIVIALTVFGIVFVGELPDKTAVASLILGARYRPLPVFLGVATAFLIHVTVAVLVGGLIAKLPRTPVEVVTGVLFLIGAVLLLRSNPDEAEEAGEENAGRFTGPRTERQVVVASFLVVLVAEFGDLTQILTATLAARYDEPVAVGIGAVLALWAVAALALTFGRVLLKVIPLRRVQQIAAVALIVLAAYSLVTALT
jgi:putative Ca2+/H+ antiporter (TMEM165/GDT1 family)